MNMNNKRFLVFMTALFFALSAASAPAQASPWAKREGYWEKTKGKFAFGLKHAFFSWTAWWTESREPQYTKEVQGFAVGLGKTVPYWAAGVIQTVTAFVPVDFPNIGIGIHIPTKDCPHRHDENYNPNMGKPAPKTDEPPAQEPALETSEDLSSLSED